MKTIFAVYNPDNGSIMKATDITDAEEKAVELSKSVPNASIYIMQSIRAVTARPLDHFDVSIEDETGETRHVG